MYNHHFSLLMHKLRLSQFNYSRYVLRTFICCNVGNYFKMSTLCILFKCDLLIKYKFACFILSNLRSQDLTSILKFHLARELHLHFDRLYVQCIRVHLDLSLRHESTIKLIFLNKLFRNHKEILFKFQFRYLLIYFSSSSHFMMGFCWVDQEK